MEAPFDKIGLQQKLSKLPAWKATAFGLSIAERMLPNYVLFSRDENVVVPAVLRSALNIAWDWLQDGATTRDLLVLAEECDAAAPETEKFTSLYVSSALDAAVSVGFLLRFILDGDIQHVAEVASLARDSIDLYVQEVERFPSRSPDLEGLILRHSLMQQELMRQKKDLSFISHTIDAREVAGVIFRERWFANQLGRQMFHKES